jgi:hypothetical protein
MSTVLRNRSTGETKEVKVGFSWILFLFAGCLGIPLFLRRLHVWGAVFLALWIVDVLVSVTASPEQGSAIVFSINLIFCGLQIWLGIKGNEMTAKNLLENGWEFTEGDSDAVRFARLKWGLPIPQNDLDGTKSVFQPVNRS